MITITLTIQDADGPEIAAALGWTQASGVTRVAYVKQALVAYVKERVKGYRWQAAAAEAAAAADPVIG